MLGWAAMQTSIGPAPSHRRKSQYEDIRKLARLYLQQAPNPDPTMDEWVQSQREFLIEVAWATPHSFTMKASNQVPNPPLGDQPAQCR